MATEEPKALRLRARGPSGGPPASLPDITSASTFEDLECAIRIAFNIKESAPIVVLSGFPPQQLTLDEAAPLGSVLPVGELLTVRHGEAGDATVLQGSGAMKKGRGGSSSKAAASPAKRKADGSVSSGPGSNIRTLNGPLHKSGGGGGKRMKRQVVQSEEDLGALLVAAVSKGGGKGRANQLMRAAFRMAVEKQFDEAKANARVVAARMGTYTLTEMEDGRTLDGAATRMRVTFPKGMGSRSNHEEVVDLYTKPQLTAVIEQVIPNKDGRELLKPDNMAGCSARAFWSLVKHFGGDVEAGLKQLAPRHDWSFLHERVRKLSEKAKMNLEQEEEEKREREEAARLRKEEQEAKKAKREARRLEQLASKSAVGGGEQQQQGEEEAGEGELDPNLFPEEVDEWVQVLRKPPISIPNARVLAGQDASALAGRLRALGAKGPSEPSDEEVQKWVDACQTWEMEDIMYELLEGEEAVYDALVAANMALPKSVLLWSAAPTAMINTIREEVEPEEFEKIEAMLTPEQIMHWGANAKAMIEKMPWLDEWSATGNAEEEEQQQG